MGKPNLIERLMPLKERIAMRARSAEERKARADALSACKTLEQIKEWLGSGEEGYSQEDTFSALQRAFEAGMEG
jgi:hypothetical protein